MSTGLFLYGNYTKMFIGLVVSAVSGFIIWKNWKTEY